MLTNTEQLKKLLTESKHILLVFNAPGHGDQIAGALALKQYFASIHKQADVAATGFALPKNLKFLPHSEQIKSELAHLQKFIVKVDVSKAPIDTLSYDVKDGWLSIYLTPKTGAITKNELRTAQTTFRYDLIIALGTPDLESLGDIFFNNTDLFYKTPIINIDREAGNERYGHVNIVDVTATSLGEIIFNLLKEVDEHKIDAAIATSLLAGTISATKSFTTASVTPNSLKLASALVERGADRDQIIRHLYRTRSVGSLKLWGAALSHLQTRSDLGLVTTTLTRDDFNRSGTTLADLDGLTDELINNAPEAKITLVLSESPIADDKKIHGILTVDKNHDALTIVKSLSPVGNKRQAKFGVEGKSLKEAEEMVVKLIGEAK